MLQNAEGHVMYDTSSQFANTNSTTTMVGSDTFLDEDVDVQVHNL